MIKIDQKAALKGYKNQKIALLKAEWAKYIISGDFPSMDKATPKFNRFYKNIQDSSNKDQVNKVLINFNKGK